MRIAPPDNDLVLRGYLLKRHASEKSGILSGKQWSKRYFVLNKHRWTLSYAKSEKAKASTILPVCDISFIKAIEGEFVHWVDGCFQIKAGHLTLTLKANGNDERDRWMREMRHWVLQANSEEAQRKLAEKSGVPMAAREIRP